MNKQSLIFSLILLATIQNIHSINLKNELKNLTSNLSSFKKLIPSIKPEHLAKQSQTEAWLSIPKLKQDVDNCYGGKPGPCPHFTGGFTNVFITKPEVKKIVDQAIDREKKYKNTHYVFYHAHKSLFRILSDINTAVCHLEGRCKKNQNFFLLRNFGTKAKPNLFDIGGKKNSFFGLPNINTWTNEEASQAKKKNQWYQFDSLEQTNPFLLSINLSLFGSMGILGEQTFQYFLSDLSQLSISTLRKLIDNAVSVYIKNPSKRNPIVDKLLKLTKPNPKGATIFSAKKTGDLIQIFVPKDLVDKVVYLAKPWGRFWNYYITGTGTHEIYDTRKNRYIGIGKILKRYQNNPTMLNKPIKLDVNGPWDLRPTTLINGMQGRAFLKGEYFAQPNNDIKMFRYTTLDKNIEKKYLDEIEKIAKEIYKAKDT